MMKTYLPSNLPVIPGNDFLDVDAHGHALGDHEVDVLLALVGTEARLVALEQAPGDRPQGVAVVDDRSSSDELDTSQEVVAVAVLDQTRHARVTRQVQHLLRLPVRLERRLAIEEAVPHGDHVRPSVGANGGNRHGVTLVEE